ncbi:SRPBCC family protein [Sphingobacterium sp. SYP-B4668]|uniref:SRPBCC family protein n=1 Tax=Sphingobacterium sp. SYP-B4668 TaxID=2996035 RepID=UPI0005326AFC|nr:SRPBCC family protein [Sphingobacterium sp. SYP-B4668]
MKDLKKYFIIPAPPQDVYLALTTETTVRLWTGDEVEMEAIEGGEFSMWDGAIVGKFVTLEPSKKIVQHWYFGEQEDSIVTIKLHEHKKGTSLEVVQTNIPEEAYQEISEGWEDPYISSLIEFYTED